MVGNSLGVSEAIKTGDDTGPIQCNGAEVNVETCLVLKPSYPMSKLTFKST